MAATTCSTGHPRYTWTLPCERRSAADARSLVQLPLARWGLDDLVEDATLLVSELVGNAAAHAQCRLIRVTVTRPEQDLVLVAVVDKSHARPELREPTDSDVHGRGLLIVDALTERWGTDPLPWGKRIWCELRRKADR